MRNIKKYANRKLYDTIDKQYISMDVLSKLIKNGEEVSITDNTTGEDLTSSIVSQLIARDKKSKGKQVPSSVLIQLFRKGSDTLIDYTKKYASLWQNAITMAEDELDKLIGLLIKDKELSETEGRNFKKDITGYTNNLKKWISEKVDQRVHELFGMINPMTKDQLVKLTAHIESLTDKVEQLEKEHNPTPTKEDATN